jgi:hypothetical protein
MNARLFPLTSLALSFSHRAWLLCLGLLFENEWRAQVKKIKAMKELLVTTLTEAGRTEEAQKIEAEFT